VWPPVNPRRLALQGKLEAHQLRPAYLMVAFPLRARQHQLAEERFLDFQS
jgi:hypothetical protein